MNLIASAKHNDASNWPAVANAHAVLVTSCALDLLMFSFAAFASAKNNDASNWPAVANAHAVLVTPCVLNLFIWYNLVKRQPFLMLV